jgi:hypothetical protein
MGVGADVVVVAAFAIGGAFGKLADAVIDRELPLARMWGAFFNLLACGTLGLLASADPWAATIVLGILISGKVDSRQHVIGGAVFVALAIPALRHIDLPASLPVLAAVTAAASLDEYLHDRSRRWPVFAFVRRVLEGRLVLDLALPILVLVAGLPFRYCVAVWIFDLAYNAAGKAVARRSRATRHVSLAPGAIDCAAVSDGRTR